MKKTKAILMALCAVLLVAASVMGTLAYLTSNDSVTNTFTVGNVKITLDETDVDINGVKDTETRVQENDYKLMPGHEYVKDPIIHVDADSENCYLFVKVDNEIAAIEAAGDTTVAAQMAAKGWAPINEGSNVYVYIGTEAGAAAPVAVTANANVNVFENFTISGDVTNTQLAAYAGKTITVTAYAIQADGFADKSAAEIWAEI